MGHPLTGRRRFRMWKDKIILQVEFSYIHDYCIGPSIESEKCYAWRDATLEDLTIDTDVQLNCGSRS